jgi:MFS family permease
VAPLIVAGVGIALVFPTSADAVVSAVPPQDAGVAAGANTALREVGGVFGVAVLAAVFAANGGYADFLHGVRAALTVAAVVPIAGVVAAYLVPARKPAPEREAEPLYVG